MIFDERTVTLKDGRTCTLRPAQPDDASALIEYMVRTAGETEFVLRYPDEVQFTEEREREILGNILNDPGHVMMVGVVDGKIAGNCGISGIGMYSIPSIVLYSLAQGFMSKGFIMQGANKG